MGIANITKVFMLSLCVSTLLYADELKDNKKSIYKLDDIVVTANKIYERAQEVPQSISVIDEETINERGIKNIEDVIRLVPNMSNTKNHGMNYLNIRGLNASMFTANNPVVIYIDGIPSVHVDETYIALSNVKRIEILRGPQGTLYGKDAIGGVINIITKKPRNVLSGSLGLEYSSFNTMNANFDITGPLIDEKLYFGLNLDGAKSDGWSENVYKNDKKVSKTENKKYSAFLLAQPNDKLSIKLSASRYDDDMDRPIVAVKTAMDSLSSFKRKDAEEQDFDVPHFRDILVDRQALSVNYDLPNLLISSVLTHKKLERDSQCDWDLQHIGLKAVSNEDNNEYTGELRISNKDDDIKWVAGIYADTAKIKTENGWELPMPLNPATPNALTNMTMMDFATQNQKTYAAFGQVKFPIVNKLELTLGGRLQKFKKDIDSKFHMYPVGTSPQANNVVNPFEADKSWNTFLPKVALDYKLNDNLIPYISVSRGYMPGGFNNFAMSGGEKENSFEPQKSTNYEIGLKAMFDDFIFTANIFRMDIKDIHVFKTVGNAWITDNAKKAHSQGIEFDFSYFPTDELEISGAFGYVDAKYDDYDAGFNKLDGKRIENTPRFNANLALAYYDPSGIYGRIDTRAMGSTNYYNSTFQKMEKEGSSFTADIKVGYKVGDFDIYGFVKNITDEKRISFYTAQSGLGMAMFNDPRTYGLGLKYTF